ncbi:MAG: hypothetical protein NT080_04175 [Spirochaetes bacterium]|nr:hypothetical protein [Spirochaetota bacterium]
MQKTRLVAASVAFALATAGIFSLAAEDGVLLHGYGRSKVGALLEDGSWFISENTLDLRLSCETGDAAFYANPVLYERAGEVQLPELREAYIELGGDAFDLRVGKQQIIWGKGDGVFITDIVSPKDLSQFLIPDFEELRLAVTGARLDLYAGAHGLELVWLPWFTKTITPGATSLWAPAMPFPITPTFVNADIPEFALASGEYFAKYAFMGKAFDLSLTGGWFWNDTPSYAVLAKTLGAGGLASLTVEPEYYRTVSAGYALSGSVGPFVLRSEGAWYGDRRFQGNPMVYADGYAEKNAIQYLVGTDFSVAGINFGMQFIQDFILDHEEDLVEDRIQNTATFVVVKTFLRETLTVELFSYVGFDAPDALIKPKLTWDVSDALEIFAGAYIFLGDSGDFGQYDGNDGGYIGAKMSF